MSKENEKIKQIRSALRLTQQQLADEIGVSKQYLSQVEKGGTDLSKEKITLLCHKTGVSLDWLLSGHGQMFLKDQEISDEMFCDEKNINEFVNLLEIYNLYLISVNSIVNKKYPKAIIEDKIKTAQILYMQDCLNDNISFSQIEELKKKFEKETKKSEDFEAKILGTYYFVYTQRTETT